MNAGTSASPNPLPAILNSHPVLPKELQDLFNEFDEDDFDLYITRADFSGDNFVIDFALTVQDITGSVS